MPLPRLVRLDASGCPRAQRLRRRSALRPPDEQLDTDLSDVLPTIRVPTLVLCEGSDVASRRRTSRAGSRTRALVMLPGEGVRRCTRTTPGCSRSSRSCETRRRPTSPTRCSRPCSSPTSSVRPSSLRRSATARWRELLEAHHAARATRARSLRRRRARHGRRRVLRHLRRSRAGDRAAPARSSRRCRRSASSCASGIHTGECERVGEQAGGARGQRRRARRRRGRGRRGRSSPGRCGISSPAPASPSTISASTS